MASAWSCLDRKVVAMKKIALHKIAIVAAAGGSVDGIVKTTVYLRDMNEFADMNAVYGEFFRMRPPARATVEAARLPWWR